MFETSETPVPHSERVVRLSDGSALIWPYYNVRVGSGPWEIAVDSNRLERTQWLTSFRQQWSTIEFSVDLFPALAEKWLASPAFRKDTAEQIEVIAERYRQGGVRLPEHYAVEKADELKKGHKTLSYQWTLIFYYVAILKKIMELWTAEEGMLRLAEISSAQVPRASALLSLGALSLYLRSRQDVKLTGDSDRAYSHVQRFFSFQPGKKGEENHINIPYMRNRALDLALFYFWPVRDIQNRKPHGQPVVITEDKALHSLVFRILPLMYMPGSTGLAIPVAIAIDEFEPVERATFEKWRSRINVSFQPPADDATKRQRLENLYRLARTCTDRHDERQALDEVWQDWSLPGIPYAGS